MDAFVIGPRRGDHVAMRVARTGQLIDVDFDVVAAGVGASASSSLRHGALGAFRDALRALDEGSEAPADLATSDRALRVRVSRGADGSFVAQCFASPTEGGAILQVVVTLDGVELAELLWALDGVTRDVAT